MSKGMDMMLKSFGVDPEAIKIALESAKELAPQVKKMVDDFDARLKRIEEKLDFVISCLPEDESCLVPEDGRKISETQKHNELCERVANGSNS